MVQTTDIEQTKLRPKRIGSRDPLAEGGTSGCLLGRLRGDLHMGLDLGLA